ncbi:6058_t:CDS:2, partial [Gigaspora rosea]
YQPGCCLAANRRSRDKGSMSELRLTKKLRDTARVTICLRCLVTKLSLLHTRNGQGIATKSHENWNGQRWCVSEWKYFRRKSCLGQQFKWANSKAVAGFGQYFVSITRIQNKFGG